MNLGIINRLYVTQVQLKGAPRPYYSYKWPPNLYSEYPPPPEKRTPDAHVQKRPKPLIYKLYCPRFPPPLHTSYTMDYLLALACEGVFSGVMSIKETNHSHPLSPIKRHQFGLGILTRSRDQFSSLSFGTTKASPSCPVLVN